MDIKSGSVIDIGLTGGTATRVFGSIVGLNFVFYCAPCTCTHYHGIGGDPLRPVLGNRGSHCHNPKSPLFGRGYDLVVREDTGAADAICEEPA